MPQVLVTKQENWIEITPQMIEAGVTALCFASLGSDPLDEAEWTVQRIFLAMVEASNPPRLEK